jgi:ABC-type uncharacterized transport system permease subunit
VLPLVISSVLFLISTTIFIIGSYMAFKKKINAEMELQNIREMSGVPLIASLVNQNIRRNSLLKPTSVPDVTI